MRIPAEAIHTWMQRIDESTRRIENAWSLERKDRSARLHALKEKLEALDPESILERGYAICRSKPSMEIVTASEQVDVGDTVNLVLTSGELDATIAAVIPGENSKNPKADAKNEKSAPDSADPDGFEESGQTTLW